MSESHTPNSSPQLTDADKCMVGFVDDKIEFPVVSPEAEAPPTAAVEYNVGGLACAAWAVDVHSKIPNSDEALEVVVPVGEEPYAHYVYLANVNKPYSISQTEQAVEDIGESASILLPKIVSGTKESVYRLPSQAVSLQSTVIDAITSNHPDVVNRLFSDIAAGLRELTEQKGCLPNTLSLSDLCISRKDGSIFLVPPKAFDLYEGSELADKYKSLQDNLAAEIYARSARLKRSVELNLAIEEFA